jgi:transcriptional regulator with XRE-family HTH domain
LNDEPSTKVPKQNRNKSGDQVYSVEILAGSSSPFCPFFWLRLNSKFLDQGGKRDQLKSAARKPRGPPAMNRAQILSYIGEQIRMKREEASMTQAEVAKELGLSQEQISRIERGRRAIDANHLYEFAVLVQQPVEVFFPVQKGSVDTLEQELIDAWRARDLPRLLELIAEMERDNRRAAKNR